MKTKSADRALFLGYLASAGVALALLVAYLSWRAPWRTTEIVLAGVACALAGLLMWRYLRRLRPGLAALALAALAACLGLYHHTSRGHLARELPPVADGMGLAGPSAAQVGLLPFLQLPLADYSRRAADQVLANRYALFGYDARVLPENPDWTEDPVDDRSWNFDLHNMHFLVALVDAHVQSRDPRYLRKAQALVLDWIDDNTGYYLRPPTEFSWNEHSVAFRLMNFLYFFDVWKQSGMATPDQLQRVYSAMLGHAAFCAERANYFDNHNHGIDQDRALMAFALMHPQDSHSSAWLQLALQRMARQVEFAISPGGIHLEHSPSYHLYGISQLQRTLDFLRAAEVRDPLLDLMAQRLAKMYAFVPWLVKPDGLLAQLGDTPVVPIRQYDKLLAAAAKDDPALQQLLAGGALAARQDAALALKDEGYVIARNFDQGRRPFQDSFYLFFTAGAHEGRGHRQADDLSFVLSDRGQELLVDPGVYSYKLDAARRYVLSTAAHNTVLVDGASYTGWDTRLEHFSENAQLMALKASHRNYPGLEHVRRLAYVKPSLLFVVDEVRPLAGAAAPAQHRFEQLFHFAPALKLVANAAGAEVMSARGGAIPALRVSQLGAGKASVIAGWHSPQHARLVPAPALSTRIDGTAARFVTVLDLQGQARAAEYQSVEAGRLLTISWRADGQQRELQLDLAGDAVRLR